jgi:hypothetical protein
MVKAKPHNKTEDLILKIKEVMGYLDRDSVAKAYKSYTSRTKAIVTADGFFLLNKWILNLFICNFYFILTKSDDFHRCCDSL